MMRNSELSRHGLIEEVKDTLSGAKSQLFEKIEQQVANEKLAELSGQTQVVPTRGNESWTTGIDIFMRGIRADYEWVIADQPEVGQAIDKFVQTIKNEVLAEVEKVRLDYAHLTLSFDDPFMVATNDAEKSLIQEACDFLRFDIVTDEDGVRLVSRYFPREKLSIVINVGIKNLLADFSAADRPIRLPVIRKILAMVAERAK